MGYLAAETCWASSDEAAAAVYGAVAPVVQVDAGGSTISAFTYSGTAWNLSQYSVATNGAWSLNYSTAAPGLNFPACSVANDPVTNFTDGVALGWGVVFAMAIAWGFREMKRNAK